MCELWHKLRKNEKIITKNGWLFNKFARGTWKFQIWLRFCLSVHTLAKNVLERFRDWNDKYSEKEDNVHTFEVSSWSRFSAIFVIIANIGTIIFIGIWVRIEIFLPPFWAWRGCIHGRDQFITRTYLKKKIVSSVLC